MHIGNVMLEPDLRVENKYMKNLHPCEFMVLGFIDDFCVLFSDTGHSASLFSDNSQLKLQECSWRAIN
jgi:hypothetical protein